MAYKVTIHYDNSRKFVDPYLWIWYDGSHHQENMKATGSDDYGVYFTDVEIKRSHFKFKFKDGGGTAVPWEGDSLNRQYNPYNYTELTVTPGEIWCKGDNAFVYHCRPEPVQGAVRDFLKNLNFKTGQYIPDAGGLSGLGAHLLDDGKILFSFYHPNAAQVYLVGDFNNWQHPGRQVPEPDKFIKMQLYRGYFNLPNTWIAVIKEAKPADQYKFYTIGGIAKNAQGIPERYCPDPYSRRVMPSSNGWDNSVILDVTNFPWTDQGWQIPDPSELILYEMSVYGFTEGDHDIAPENKGKYKGIAERIQKGYFQDLGITALSLMPLAEFSGMQGATALGYNSSLFFTPELDFGHPDELRQLVNTAHNDRLAVILDMVFNHTDNNKNPLWGMILEHPGEADNPAKEGGLYFDGETDWGNKVATYKKDVQNMLIDSCKMWMKEYHADGFRFDASHTNFMDHGFMLRMAEELKAVNKKVILIAENLPNQPDLNLHGYNGYGQWCDFFHDKMKALLNESSFDGTPGDSSHLGDIFYFCKGNSGRCFASHTNNVINYCESHDEHSVSHEVSYIGPLNNGPARERKARLGLFASMVALGQPMLYMGQEFNINRARNIVSFDWPASPGEHGFFQWAKRLINLRKRYPGLRVYGNNPAGEGKFHWILGPWMSHDYGGGKKIIGFRTHPDSHVYNATVVLINFENHSVVVNLNLGIRGKWIKLADTGRVHDIPEDGRLTDSHEATSLYSRDGNFSNFVLPDSSGFIYKWFSG